MNWGSFVFFHALFYSAFRYLQHFFEKNICTLLFLCLPKNILDIFLEKVVHFEYNIFSQCWFTSDLTFSQMCMSKNDIF